MSEFRVNLRGGDQGNMDVNSTTGLEVSTSIQRTIYVAGPNGVNRKLSDGETFVDSNYWKRYAYPQMTREDAFLEVVTDDGSIWSEDADENTYPRVYSLTVVNESTYEDEGNTVDIIGDTGSFAVFVQITNQGEDEVSIRLNGSDDAIITLDGGDTQVFNHGDLTITSLEFANTVSGGNDTTVQVIVAAKSSSNS